MNEYSLIRISGSSHSPLIRLLVIHFWGPLPFPDAGKGKCCMWLANQVEIYFSKMAFMDHKLPKLNAPGTGAFVSFTFGVGA